MAGYQPVVKKVAPFWIKRIKTFKKKHAFDCVQIVKTLGGEKKQS